MTKKFGFFFKSIIVATSIVMISFGLNTNSFVYSSNNLFGLLKSKLIQDGFSNKKVNDLYDNIETHFDAAKVVRYFYHNEAKLNYNQFTNDSSIKNAFAYIVTHHDSLLRAEKKYGVNKEIITAILLVETRLGKYVGKNNVFNVLSNMAALMGNEARNIIWNQLLVEKRMSRKVFEKKADNKSAWAYEELKAFLRYTDQEKIDPLSIKGSYAGAIGIAQFMPSNLFLMNKDSSNKGTINLFNHSDAICSVANYLRYHGWHSDVDEKEAMKIVRSYNNSSYYVNTVIKINNILKS